jgi:hypothetical protein
MLRQSAASFRGASEAAQVGEGVMVDMTAIDGFVTSIRAAMEITKAMKDVRDANLMQTKVFELTREIIAAQSYAMEAMSAQSTLLARNRQLEEKISALETWNAEKNRYYLKSIQTGVTVYALKEGMENGEEPHYLCPKCYNRGKKSILQKETQEVGRVPMWVCHDCGTDLIEHGIRHESTRSRNRR